MKLTEESNLANRLRAAGVENAAFESRIFLKHAGDDLETMIERRLSGEPLNRVLGYAEFYGLDFELSPDTLDPRQDTELLVDLALERFTGNDRGLRVLDLGTGTGCIIISVLKTLSKATGVATDLSAGALEIATKNARKHGADDRITFVQSDWCQKVGGTFDLILSNPPYIDRGIIPNLAKNVRNYDPILALDGGDDGMDAHKIILTETKKMLNPGGVILLEIGYDQAEKIARLVENIGATLTRIVPDYAGNPRVAEISHGDK